MTRGTRPLLKLDAQGNIIPDVTGNMQWNAEYSGTTMIYYAESRPGTADDATGWRIMKYTYAAGIPVKKTFASSNPGVVQASSDFDFIWDSRASYFS